MTQPMATTVSDPRTDRRGSVRSLYAGELLSGLGDGIFWVGLIVAISDAGSFDLLLALAVIVRLGPRSLLSIPVGYLIDRCNVRSLLIAADLIRASIMLALGIAFLSGLAVQWVLVGAALSYVVGVAWRPAVAASLPSIVSERELAHANAMISSIRQVMTFVGPLAGVAVVWWSVPATITINGIALALTAACVGSVPRERWPSGDRTALRPAAVDVDLGAPEFRRGIAAISMLTALMYFVRGAEMVLHVLVVRDLLDADLSAVGYLGGAVGLGALLVTPLARRIAAREQAIWPIVGSIALTALPTAALAASGRVATAALLVIPVGAGMVLFEVLTVVTVQRTSPPSALGRSFGLLGTASNSGKLAGAVATPWIAAAIGTANALALVAALVAAGGLATFIPLRRVSRRAELRRVELAPKVTTLRQLTLFQEAPQQSLERIAESVRTETVSAGDVLIREHDPADDLFVIVTGSFDIVVDDRVVNQVGAVDFVGEIGLVEERPRTATVRAREQSDVWRIPGDLFLAVLAGTDDDGHLDVHIARRMAVTRPGHRTHAESN